METAYNNQFVNYRNWISAGEMSSDLYHLPTELLLLIFSLLSAKDLIKCRRICHRFKQIVDDLSHCETLWRRHCATDFSDMYKIAYMKARPGVHWQDIYQSLTLWPKLDLAQETIDEFASASSVIDEIRNIEILQDGVLGVHKRGSIVYYDLESMKPINRGSITGDYLRYAENEEAIAILSYHLQLFIIRKAVSNPQFETNVTFGNVKTFILVKNEVYFVNLTDEISKCNLDAGEMTSKLIKKSEDGIMCLGYTDNLHVLTFERNIYTVLNGNFLYTCSLGADSNILHQLHQYNLLERLDWRIYFQWMYVFNHSIPEGPLRDIVTVRAYGDVYFVGSNWGVLRIYYSPYSSGEFDLYNAHPIKQYNFMERYDCPVLSMCPIIQVDVMESKEGHTVIVAMPKKIAVLNFTHCFNRAASVAVIPCKAIQRIKALKISD